ncbi:MAG: hypothetical protein MJZ08_06695 [Bacteroidaceae bacterium]|nr:hypothetical protein [Bacteroidaceae bacterium]
MAISYSIARNKNLKSEDKENLVYALAQSDKTVNVETVARYAVSHYGPEMHYTQVLKAIDMLKQTAIDLLKDGNRVSLGELGTLFYHIESKSKPESEFQEKGFQPSHDIKDVTVKWSPSTELKSLMQHGNLTFKQRSSLKMRNAMLKEENKKPE